MHRVFSVVAAGTIGLAVLLPSSGVAHAASTTYKTLTRSGFTTQYPATFQTGDFASKSVLHNSDARLFTTLTGVGSPDGAAVVFVGMRKVQDSPAQVNTYERTALANLPKGYKRVGSVSQASKHIGAHSYLVTSDVLTSGKTGGARFVYSTTLGGRTFYFFLQVSSSATMAEEQGVGYVIGATRAV